MLELIYQGHDRGFWVIEEGHRHPHNSDGVNEKHEIDESEIDDIELEIPEPLEDIRG